MNRHATTALLAAALFGACLGPEAASAALMSAPAALASRSLANIQRVGRDCDLYRCRWRPGSAFIKIISPRKAPPSWGPMALDLDCCHSSSPRLYGYGYGPQIALDYYCATTSWWR